MTKATMIEVSKTIKEELEVLTKHLQVKKKDIHIRFNKDYPKYDLFNENNNDKESLLIYLKDDREFQKIDGNIWKMKIAIQKIENLLMTLEELE